MLEYFAAADKLHLDVLRCLAIAMGLDEEFFTPLCDGNHQNLRLLHYPSCQRDRISAGGQKRGGVHSDYGSITLLTQWQDQGGLEACRKDGKWCVSTRAGLGWAGSSPRTVHCASWWHRVRRALCSRWAQGIRAAS